ncbi:MAG TPA: ABC transporter permease [Acidimicrobiia bacterium]|nr:ABC transporter permease [Acidimicrobiia bacterium]
MASGRGISGGLTRAYAFFKKEVLEVFRQPRLLLTLVIGPFLILFLFGIGFDPDPPVLKTVLVAPPGSGLSERSEDLAAALGAQADLVGVVPTVDEATAMIDSRQANIAIVIPENAVETVRSGEQAVITIFHDQIDPFEAGVVELFAVGAIDQVNREVLQDLVLMGQEEAEQVEEPLPEARAAVEAMEQAARSEDDDAFESGRSELEAALTNLAAQMGPSRSVLDRVNEQTAGGEESGDLLDTALQRVQALEGSTGEERVAELETLSAELDELETTLEDFRSMDPSVLVSPFRGQAINYRNLDVVDMHFYIPGVVSLLVQHLTLTFAALSLVKERSQGALELFRVSPLSGGEMLAGKYLANVVIGLLVGAALTAAAVFTFDFRPAGSWLWYGFAVLLVVLAAQGIGFILSALAKTESQAVQYAMITLLVSIFFCGFFISIDRLLPSVRPVSFLLPATYGIRALQEVSFWGRAPSLELIGGAVALAVVLALLALAFMRRSVRAARPSRREARALERATA